mmetsp:Transcript_16219/g.50934  ORF Transcript_16219/g.50934 Transcript_16219/m.50934 type:complete len:261 (+) Transcript_16219:1296-2078(+)
MKIRSKEDLRRCNLEEQFRRSQERMLNMPSHPGVVRLEEVLEDDTFYYVVMEKANGGSLFHSLVNDFKDGCMPAAAMKQVMREILEAVSHVHKQGMLHRDIKPDNLVMQIGADGSKRAMLVDFDHADPDWRPETAGQQFGQVFGTLRFNAPEALTGEFRPESDLYSTGVILYLLMTGRFPYGEEVYSEGPQGNNWSSWQRRSAVHQRMHETTVDFHRGPWEEQPACKELCQSLLSFTVAGRPSSAEEALRHDWFTQGEAA